MMKFNKSFDFILRSSRSQKSLKISIQRSSNEVKMLHDYESDHAEFSLMRHHLL